MRVAREEDEVLDEEEQGPSSRSSLGDGSDTDTEAKERGAGGADGVYRLFQK